MSRTIGVGGLDSALDATVQRVEALLLGGREAREALGQLALIIDALSGGMSSASILVLDDDGLLRNGASPSLPRDYLEKIDKLKPHPLVGTCAAAAATGRTVVTPDLQDDDKWAELRHFPLALGFRAAWSMPLKDESGRVVGTFGTYFRESRQPTEQEIDSIARLAPLASRAIAQLRNIGP